VVVSFNISTLVDEDKQETYFNETEAKKRILKMTLKEARENGIKYRSTLKRIKDKIRQRKKVNWNGKEIRKLIN